MHIKYTKIQIKTDFKVAHTEDACKLPNSIKNNYANILTRMGDSTHTMQICKYPPKKTSQKSSNFYDFKQYRANIKIRTKITMQIS